MTDIKVLIFESSENKFAIDLNYVDEILRMPKWVRIPNYSEFFRGVINLRNRVIPLFDLRKYLGFKSISEEANEFISMLKEREQDHINWINELLSSVEERREFKLTTDPRMCKFGKWYYSFHTNNIVISNHLSNFEQPHNVIHHIGIKVQEMVRLNNYDEALNICHNARDNELTLIRKLFKDLYKAIEESVKEFAVIINFSGALIAFNADKIDRIVKVLPENIKTLEGGKFNGNVKEIIKYEDDLLLKLNVDSIFSKG